MSCFVMSPESIATIAYFLSNDSDAQWSFNGNYRNDWKGLAADMMNMNEDAYHQRYDGTTAAVETQKYSRKDFRTENETVEAIAMDERKEQK